ncbi:MAG: enoyl-CoA hydratase/isomerase family protein [Kurthia sp.]|nr:enoyl-CoA hydratase/isomerase family protein [Candidatus Kurthia equi]
MVRSIQKAAVLGSGVMGSGIAAHLANCGIETYLFDIVPPALTDDEKTKGLTLENPAIRNKFANTAVQKLLKQKPAPLTTKRSLSLIQTGNLEDDLHKLSEVDWIIEVVTENLEIKKSLYEKVDSVRKQGAIISSNTSGISINEMAEGRSEDFQRHFLGTHFFNPPRYLKLLEVIPSTQTDKEVVEFMKEFSEDKLGKGVVIAKDTPNFIANRIGTYGLLKTLQVMREKGYSVGEVDSVTGPVIGRPKSATLRTLDVVGLDTFIHVANTVYNKTTGEEQTVFAVPEYLQKMVDNGWLGAKSGQGFFVKKGKEILELNLDTFEYEPSKKLKTPSMELAKQQKGLANRVKALIYAEDRVGDLLWSVLMPTIVYSAEMYGEIADSVVAMDEAMRWGFGWSQGPFEIWDAIGVEKSIEKMKAEGVTIPAFVQGLLDKGFTTFYKEVDGVPSYYNGTAYVAIPKNAKEINLKQYKKQHGVLKSNAGASVIDFGDGVLLLEFHSKSNSLGLDIMQMLTYAMDLLDASDDYKGLVIGNQGKNFSVGANLGMILMEAQDDNIFELDYIVKQFQQGTLRIKYSNKPVVVAPFGMTLGGGAEVCLPAAHIQATTETYMGLVEAGVGLLPGGGGNKELYMKHLKGLPNGVEVDLINVAASVFEKIATAKTSMSGEEARDNNFLNFTDAVSVNPDHQLYDAKQAVLGLYQAGYKAPAREKVPVSGSPGYAAMLLGADGMLRSGFISPYDMEIAKKIALVLSGGKIPYGSLVDEQYLLDLERKAFLELVAHPNTQARMQHMLVKGKPLRN